MDLIVFVCLTLCASTVMAIENGKTTPLHVDNPISGSGQNGENKSANKVENRYDDPPPEYYK